MITYMYYDIISIRTIVNFVETDPLFANSSCIVCLINTNHGFTAEWHMGKVMRGYTEDKSLHLSRWPEIPSLMERDGMFFCTFTSSEYEILDIMTLCIYVGDCTRCWPYRI